MKFYRIWVVDREDPYGNPVEDSEPRFVMEGDTREYLEGRGEEWTRLWLIHSYYITEHEVK